MTAVPPARQHADGAGDHPSDELLALSLEGPAPEPAAGTAQTPDPADALLQAAELADLERHLAGCARCQARRGELAGVPSLLRALAGGGAAAPGERTAAMPDDVAELLDRALRDAAAAPSPTGTTADPGRTADRRHAPVPSGGARPDSQDVVPLHPRRPRRSRRPRSTALLSAAAALAAVGLVGGVLWGAVSGGSTGSAGSTASAGGVSAPALPSGGGSAGSGAGPVLVPTALDLDAGTLADGVRSALRTPPSAPVPLSLSVGAPSGSPATAAGSGPLAGLLTPAGLRTCVQRLAPGQPLREVLAVRWQGEPAAVLVFTTPGDPGHVDAYAVVPACPVGEFLGFVRLPA